MRTEKEIVDALCTIAITGLQQDHAEALVAEAVCIGRIQALDHGLYLTECLKYPYITGSPVWGAALDRMAISLAAAKERVEAGEDMNLVAHTQ